jgi:hypothetical protein
MTTIEIKILLLSGKNFSNENANWFTNCKPSEKIYLITIGERNLFCKNLDSAAKRIKKLINTGN